MARNKEQTAASLMRLALSGVGVASHRSSSHSAAARSADEGRRRTLSANRCATRIAVDDLSPRERAEQDAGGAVDECPHRSSVRERDAGRGRKPRHRRHLLHRARRPAACVLERPSRRARLEAKTSDAHPARQRIAYPKIGCLGRIFEYQENETQMTLDAAEQLSLEPALRLPGPSS